MIASLALAAISTLVLISHLGLKMGSYDRFLSDNGLNIKFQLVRFHAGIEKLTHQDSVTTREHVWQHLQQANRHVQAILQSADSTQSGSLPKVDPRLRGIAKHTQARIAVLEQVAHEHLQDRQAQLDRGAADPSLEEIFLSALEAAQALEVGVRNSMSKQVLHYRSLSYGLGAILLLFAVVVATQVYLAERNRQKTLRSLRQNERSLRYSEQGLLSLVETMSDWVWKIDSNGTYSYASENVADLLGYRANEIVGSTAYTDMAEDKANLLPKLFAKKVQAREPLSRVQVPRMHKNRSKLVCEVSAVPIYGAHGAYLGYIGVDRDITERKRAAAQLRTQTAELATMNRELESFSYSVSHDLRAPLRAIGGFSQALLEDYADRLDETGCDYLTRIHVASLRMSELIDDLLMLCKVTRREMRCQQVNLSAMAAEVAAELEHSDSERVVDFRIEEGLWILCDQQLLRIVVENLLGNSYKYTAHEDCARIELGAMRHLGKRIFFIRDNGVGFDRQYSHKLFQPFQRLHSNEEFEGTGIGLATVARIIQRHHGKVWADAQVDEGATFYFSLPDHEA